jgi:uncharacterized protein (DUF608 family)
MPRENRKKSGSCGGPSCGCGGVSRRRFLSAAGAGAAALAASGGASRAFAGPFSPQDTVDHFIPADKKLDPAWVKALFARGERTWFSGKDLETIGMPVGGVCAGQLYLAGDGRLLYWDIFNTNHHTGWGANNYKVRRKPSEWSARHGQKFIEAPSVDQGFAIRFRSGDRTLVRPLSAEGFKTVRFAGEYPIGMVEYFDPDLPLALSLEAFSPFIPLNAADSALPVTVMSITAKNTGSAAAEVTLAGWLQNAVCHFTGTRLGEASRRINQPVKEPGLNGVLGRVARGEKAPAPPPGQPPVVFADFEGDTYGDWKVEGEAFGAGPVKGTLPNQQTVGGFRGKRLVNTFLDGDRKHGKLVSPAFRIERRYIGFLIGGGDHAGRTCVNLVVDGKTVRTAAGRNSEELAPENWDVKDLAGKEAHLEIVDAESGPWGHVNVDRIEFRDAPMGDTFAVLEKPFDEGTMGLWILGPDPALVSASLPAGKAADVLFTDEGLGADPQAEKPLEQVLRGAVGRKTTLKPGESVTVSFLVTWCMPNLYFGRGGQDDNGTYESYLKVARDWVGNQYAKRFADAGAVARFVSAEFERLAGQTRLWHRTAYDSTLPWWLLDRIGATNCNLATNTCQWWQNGRFWAWEGVGCCHGTCGHVWNYAHGMARLFPELERSVREMQDFKTGVGFKEQTGAIIFRGENFGIWAGDSQGGYILKAWREHQCSADDGFLRRVWPAVRKAMEFMIQQDGDSDGLIEGKQHNTYDIDFYGPNTMVGSLYLGALRAAEEMAREMGDGEFAGTCRKVFENGRKNSVERLFNGEYFVQKVDLAKHPKHQYADGCLADQLFGQGWAHQVGLGYVYPRETVLKALASIWKYDWAPDIGPQNKAHGPQRWFAYPGEAGLFTCTWPKSKHLGPESVLYRDEVWTGIEYQVANHMAWEGMLTEALAVCRAAHDRYHPSKHNPFNEIECGDHYARAMAAWGMITSLAGFEHHGPRGHLGFAPRLKPEDFKSVFTASEGWGTIAQQRQGGLQINRVAVKWGRVRVRTLAVVLPADAKPGPVSATLDGKALTFQSKAEGSRVVVTLPEGTAVEQGKELALTVPYA